MKVKTYLACTIVICLIQLVPGSFLKAQGLYFPPVGSPQWQKTSPSSLNYCKPEIDSLYNYLKANNTKAFILLKDGKIVLEKYFGDFNKDSSWEWKEASHTLTAALFGIAQSNHLLDIEAPVQKYLGEAWTSLSPEKETEIKVEDHLKMTTGLKSNKKDNTCIKPECLGFKSIAGEQWMFHQPSYLILESILKVAADQSFNQFLFNYLRGAIGLSGSYSNDAETKSYRSNARAAARFGLFLLAKGSWEEKVIITDDAFFNQMTSPSQELNLAYGYLTWLNGQSNYQLPQSSNTFEGELVPYAPIDLFAAFGKDGQLINIVPSEGLVWVRFGDAPQVGNGSIAAIFNNNIWKRIQQLDCQAFSITSESDDINQLSPKPGKDEIRISTKVPIQKLLISDETGKVHFAEDINSKKLSINTKQFEKGIYFARIYFSEEIVSTQKFEVK